jgi:hypothetical protein
LKSKQNQKVKTMSNKLNALNTGQVLGRSEMKKIMAGSGGNIYCSMDSTGWQFQCYLQNLEHCLDSCVDTWGDDCGGCAQFP